MKAIALALTAAGLAASLLAQASTDPTRLAQADPDAARARRRAVPAW